MIMQLAVRPYVTAGVAVLGAGLIYVTPVAAPNVQQRAVELAAAGEVIDLLSPIDTVVGNLGGAGGSLWDSVTDALVPEAEALNGGLSGAVSSLGDLNETFADGLPSMASADSVDVWQQLWLQFYDAVIPIVGPIELVGLILLGNVILYADWFFQTIYDDIVGALGGASAPAVTEALGLGTFTAAATEALDLSALPSVLDLNPIADIGTVVDPAAIADIGTAIDPSGIADVGSALSISTIPDLGEILTSLVP
jgi:hypothetical protein